MNNGNEESQSWLNLLAPEKLQVRLTMDVTYCLNGENSIEMTSNLRKMCERAIGEGLLTGETDAEVDNCSVSVAIQPDPLSESELADFMLERIESGELHLEHIPDLMARYGLMEPIDFTNEMRERIALSKTQNQ